MNFVLVLTSLYAALDVRRRNHEYVAATFYGPVHSLPSAAEAASLPEVRVIGVAAHFTVLTRPLYEG